MKIRKNDTVKVLYGKDSGKRAKVMKIFPKENTLVVEGLNVFKKHVKGDGRKTKSGIVDLIKPMNAAKVMLVCPSCDKPTRVSMENGDRICKKCKKKVDGVVKKETEKKETGKKEKKTVKKTVKKTKKVNKNTEKKK